LFIPLFIPLHGGSLVFGRQRHIRYAAARLSCPQLGLPLAPTRYFLMVSAQ
jgi:hypothetical protein